MPLYLVYGIGEPDKLPVSEYALHLKKGLEDAYQNVRSQLITSHEHRKKYYDKSTHGKPYTVDKMVCLHSAVIPHRRSRKLHHPWTGPFQVMKRLTECDYWIKSIRKKRKTHVVHFNRLKLCAPGTRFEQDGPTALNHSNKDPNHISSHLTPSKLGVDIELIDYGDQLVADELHEPIRSHYPSRARHCPDRFVPGVA